MNNKQVLNLESRTASDRDLNGLYLAALPPERSALRQVLEKIRVAGGLSLLIWLALAEPFTGILFQRLLEAGLPAWLLTAFAEPLVMALRAVLMVESFGYMYHRFFQHVGFLTRTSAVLRRNQKFHWIHHMVIYPIGSVYKRARTYIQAEKGVGWSWVLPGLAVAIAFLSWHGVNPGSLVFVGVLGWYAKFVVDRAHGRFHEVDHPWARSAYFHWLEDIHVLHHWDQRKNFTIVHPLMDILFGTYLSPARHGSEIRAAESDDLTVSDVINWRYLLLEATPLERAAFISNVKTHRQSLAKLRLLYRVLGARLSLEPEDREAQTLRFNADELFRVIGAAA